VTSKGQHSKAALNSTGTESNRSKPKNRIKNSIPANAQKHPNSIHLRKANQTEPNRTNKNTQAKQKN
jgi:hypothetical protein